MKEYKKEIIFCIIALVVAGCAIWFFTHSLKEEKKAGQTELFRFVNGEAMALLQINRMSHFNEFILKNDTLIDKSIYTLPDVYRGFISQQPEECSLLFSLFAQGSVLYANINSRQATQIKEHILPQYFPSYPPHSYEKYGIRFSYYADTDNRFFGSFYTGGVWVGSYSRKLLEGAARCYLTGKGSIVSPGHTFIPDSVSAVSLYLQTNYLDLCFQEADSIVWRAPHSWLNCEIFAGEHEVCILTNFSAEIIPEEWIDPVTTTFTHTINNFIQALCFEAQADTTDHKDDYFYMGCAPLD